MASFDASKKWTIITPLDAHQAKKAIEDLSRCIGLLGAPNLPVVLKASDNAPVEAIIVLNDGEGGPGKNGFGWRAVNERVEIFGESDRGLCNGIYSFLAALGLSWPAPGQEKLPEPKKAAFPLSTASVREPSGFDGKNTAAVHLRRYVPANAKEIRDALKNSEAFAAWAGRNRYDALVFPLTAFACRKTRGKLKQLKQFAQGYGITLEAGGWDLSSLVPRRYFFFLRDAFRMEEGKRKKAHHFCPTSLNTTRIMNSAGKKLLNAAEGIEVFHLWPDKGAETAWCSCPTCRAFTFQEQNRMGVNAAADTLATINPNASITCFEKPSDEGKIPLRKNVFRLESLPRKD